jgi:VWFA-related protein
MRCPSAALLLLLVPALATFAAPPLRAQLQAGQAPFLEQVQVDVVNVDVHVTDASGQPVPGLGKGDFEILEDGKPVKITNFEAVTGDRVPARETAAAPPPSGAVPAATATPAAPAPGLAEEQRFHLVVYVDDFNLRPAHRARVLAAIRKLVAQELNPADRVMLVSYDQGVHVRLPFTSDRAAIASTLDRMAGIATTNTIDSQRRTVLRDLFEMRDARKRRGDPCDTQIEQPIAAYAESSRQEVLRSIRGLTLLVNSLAGVPGRKALLHVSDGLQLTPGEDLYEVLNQLCGGATNGLKEAADQTVATASAGEGYDGNHAALDAQRYSTANDFRRLTNHANAQGVPFYTLQAGGLEGTATASAEFGLDERALQLPEIETIQRASLRNSLSFMASETGGKTIFDANDPSSNLAQMRADFTTYYSLGYSPAHHGDGKEHRIEVRMKRRGVRARYRQSYRDEPVLERAVNRTLATLLHGFEDNPIEITLTAEAATPAGSPNSPTSGTWQVPVRLRIPLWKLAILTREEAYDGRLRLLVMTRDAGDKLSPVRQVEVPIHIPKTQVLTALGQYFAYDLSLELPAGRHRLAVAVRDEYGGTTSYLGKDLDVGGSKEAK